MLKFFKQFIIFTFLSLLFSCSVSLKEEDKIFHAAPSESGFGCTYFCLYKNNIYEFCDGDFMDPGCYTGEYKLNGDTLTFYDLKLNDHVTSNRFIIYRFNQQDSTYWKNKYSLSNFNWKELKKSDLLSEDSGDIYELGNDNKPKMKVKYWHVIRFDKLKHNR